MYVIKFSWYFFEQFGSGSISLVFISMHEAIYYYGNLYLYSVYTVYNTCIDNLAFYETVDCDN